MSDTLNIQPDNSNVRSEAHAPELEEAVSPVRLTQMASRTPVGMLEAV